MTVDSVGDSFDIFDDQNEHCLTITWNGREVCAPDRAQSEYPDAVSKLFQFPEQNPPFPHVVEQFDLDEPSEFTFAPCSFIDQLTLDDQPGEIVLCKGLVHRVWDGVKKTAKKTADLVKKALEAIAHGTKKAAKKVKKFAKHHKREILIAAAVIAAASGAWYLSGLLNGGAAAAGGAPKKREGEEGENTAAASPPSDPPPLPDWVQDLVKTAAPNFSPTTASDPELENAKNEVHNAWETLNHLKNLTEADLAHLRKEDPKFDPSSTAVQTILNTVLNDAQRHEFSKTSFSQQNWQDFIRSGHERIDQAFSEVSAYKAAALRPPAPQLSIPSFFDKVKLGLQIIGRGMVEPELLDPNSPLDLFLKNQNITASIENPNQTIGGFLEEIQSTIKTESTVRADSANPFSLNSLKNVTLPLFFYSLLPAGGLSPLELSPSGLFKIEGPSFEDKMITTVNGMLTGKKEAIKHAEYLSRLCPGHPSIDGIYNHTNGPIADVLEIFTFNYNMISPMTEGFLMEKWTKFHEQCKDKPYAKIFHTCHSQGALHTRNALMRLPKEVRDRVIVVAIAPAVIVPKSLCFDSFNYASKRDFVPKGELLAAYLQANDLGEAEREEMLINLSKMHDELILLDPHEEAGLHDHDFESPTFTPKIRGHLIDYYEHKGEYR